MMPRMIRGAVVLAVACTGCAARTAQPEPAPTIDTPAAAQRQAPPPPLPLRPLEFPGFRESALPNGLQLIVVEHRGQPIANVNLYIRSGSAFDPADRTGLAEMAAELLTKGTPTRSAERIAETIEGLGGSISAFATQDYLALSATSLTEYLDHVLDVFADAALRSTFPEEELETARTRRLSALQLELSQPAEIAQRVFASTIYGEHPYGRALTQQTLRALGRDDVVRFHQEAFRPANALLVVSGDVSVEQVTQLVRRHFGDWQGAARAAPPFVQPPAREQAEITLVHRPGSVQSNILVGHVAIRPDNPDYPALQVLNKIVGGGADSRLFLILREQKGWTYGAFSQLTRPRDVGYYVANTEVRNEVTDSALSELMRQLQRVREEPVSAQELDAARNFLTGSFPLRIETAGQIAGQIAQTRLLGLPISDLLEYRERIATVTAADVQRVARQYVRPDRASIIIVGDATRVLGLVESTGLGSVRLVGVEGERLDRADLEVRASAERFDAGRLEPRTLTYQLLVQGNAMGTVTTTLARDGDAWVATQSMEGPIAQQSEVRFRDDLSAVSSKQTTSQSSLDLRIQDGRVLGDVRLPAQMGGDRAVDVEVPDGTLLPGMDEVVLAAAELAEGRSITVPVFNPLSGAAAPLTFRVTGREEVTVPAGTFAAYRVEVQGGPLPMTLLVRVDAPHIMLRQEFAGQPVALVLQSIR